MDPGDAQTIAFDSHCGRDDGYTMPAFGHRQQRMRRPTLEDDIRIDARQTAGRIESTTGDEARVEHQQRVARKRGDLDRPGHVDRKRRTVRRQQVDCFQWMVGKARLTGLNRPKQILPKMNLPALEHCQGIRPRNRLDYLYLHIGIPTRISVQETANGAFDELSGGRHLESAPIPVPQKLRTLADRAGVAQKRTTVPKQLLTFSGKNEASSDPIEELEPELLLEIADLPGECRLGNVQAHCRLRDRAHLGHGDECSRVSQIHDAHYAAAASFASDFMYWTNLLVLPMLPCHKDARHR